MTKTILLTGHSSFGNRGCEALVRSTVGLISDALGRVRFLVPSSNPTRDLQQWPEARDAGVELIDAPTLSRWQGKWGAACERWPLLQQLPPPRPTLSPSVRAAIARADMVLAIGGDNYSLDYGLASLRQIMGVDGAALRMGKPVVLWGASVGPFERMPVVERQMAAFLRRLNLITVRESSSVAYLRSIGVTANVMPVMDSALTMAPQSVDCSAWWPMEVGDGVLGLNISALIDVVRRRAGQTGSLIDEVAAFVREVLERTRLAVVLVPHVAPLNGEPRNNDDVANAQILQALGGATPRLAMVPPGLNAAQLKHVIGRFRYFIGARTHATIAAFSSSVPTLSIAYSVKAKGINRDQFGHERYVLETPHLNAGSLRAGLRLLQSEEEGIRSHYERHVGGWREAASAGTQRLVELLK